ncbi:MAG: hypothetical protein A3B25_03440 [Candidatus Ryanbacteria bacterium RIFCSPLOWO2_01_FULL_48_26]|uniref:Uncharacterized protein n=1 Tax=Candidatus Ryanbacteria bacterium RIFCSPLOWO2_01_FULL_48_26 TaxID=1802126 RepID=A0A1G2GR47_9BACT|nr:MAG: hypothetical protein A3B25_03440 [Candidatus Ryanbacteria bacterium RIFCSPLOWO2_01_FULL_48_26]
MKRNNKINGKKRQLRHGARVQLTTEFRTGGQPARVYPADSLGRIIHHDQEHENSRDIKTVEMEKPPGIININRIFLIPV